MAYINNLGQVRIGVRGWVAAQSGASASVTDSDATAFVTAAGITDSTQISALNTLVTDLKTYGLWTKMKALYPFVGGSAASHKFNLKDPRDLDAAYRLVFNGGWVHSSTGALPNGTTAFADTKLNATILTKSSTHLSFYSKTNNPTIASTGRVDIGCQIGALTSMFMGISDYGGYNVSMYVNSGNYISSTNPTDTRGFMLSTVQSLTSLKSFWYQSGGSFTQKGSTITTVSGDLPNNNIYISRNGSSTSSYEFSNRESVFASIGDGLTDTEASNFYISVQKFQTTLGRHVGTPYVSDPDAIAFLMAAGITDGTQAAAINTLVIRMKADGIWTKMKAIYPFVGGSAASHKWNLKDPRDLDAAYRLVFTGGWTHTGTGAKPNGTTGYANTYLNPYVVFGNNQGLFPANSTHQLIHVSKYSRTNSITTAGKAEGVYSHSGNQARFMFYAWDTVNVPNGVAYLNGWGYYKTYSSVTLGNRSDGFFVINRDGYTSLKSFRNNTLISTNNTDIRDYNEVGLQLNLNANQFFFIGARNDAYDLNLRPYAYNDFETSFQSIGWSLTDTEASNFYSAVQAFQTTLGRQTDVPLVSDTDAQAFLNAANITSFQQASAVNKLVIDLKAAGVWTKMKAIYPFVGGSAASHKFNLKDPRDLDAAYRLVFNGGWTHTSTGAQPNGTTGYADTKLSPLSVLTSANHFSFYNNGSISNTQTTIDIGSGNGDPNAGELYLWTYREDGTMKYDNGSSITNRVSASTTSKGFSLGSRTSNISQKIYKNGNLLATNTNVNVNSLPYPSIYIGSGNINGTSQYPSNKQSAFVSIGDGLTDLESTALYTAVQTYQTSLGRAVDTPVYNNGLVLNLDAGNANSYPGTGTTWFDLASGNNGTLVNGPTYDTANGGSLLFDGVNDRVSTFGTQFPNNGSKTIDVWFRTTSTVRQGLCGTRDTLSTGWVFTINRTTTGRLTYFHTGSGVAEFAAGITTNTWYNAVATHDSTNGLVKIYLNGSLIGSSNVSVIYSSSFNGVIGDEDSNVPSTPFKGNIPKVAIYNKVLTDTEILNNFNSTRGRFGL